MTAAKPLFANAIQTGMSRYSMRDLTLPEQNRAYSQLNNELRRQLHMSDPSGSSHERFRSSRPGQWPRPQSRRLASWPSASFDRSVLERLRRGQGQRLSPRLQRVLHPRSSQCLKSECVPDPETVRPAFAAEGLIDL